MHQNLHQPAQAEIARAAFEKAQGDREARILAEAHAIIAEKERVKKERRKHRFNHILPKLLHKNGDVANDVASEHAAEDAAAPSGKIGKSFGGRLSFGGGITSITSVLCRNSAAVPENDERNGRGGGVT